MKTELELIRGLVIRLAMQIDRCEPIDETLRDLIARVEAAYELEQTPKTERNT